MHINSRVDRYRCVIHVFCIQTCASLFLEYSLKLIKHTYLANINNLFSRNVLTGFLQTWLPLTTTVGMQLVNSKSIIFWTRFWCESWKKLENPVSGFDAKKFFWRHPLGFCIVSFVYFLVFLSTHFFLVYCYFGDGLVTR